MSSIVLLPHPHREESRVLETFVIAEACHRILRKYQAILENQNSLPQIIRTILSLVYPNSNDKFLQRDIRFHMGNFAATDSLYGKGNLQRSLELTLDYIRFQFKNIDIDEPIRVDEKIIDEISQEIMNRFNLSNSSNGSIDLSSDPIYYQTMISIYNAMQLGYFFANMLYTGLDEESLPDNFSYQNDFFLGTRILGGSMKGRPVVCTTETSQRKVVYFNSRAFNAYYQIFLFFLFYHEITAHLWSNLQPVSSNDIDSPQLIELDVFEEAFVHWVAVHYLKNLLFSELSSYDTELIEEKLREFTNTDSISISFGEIRRAFEVYEQYFQMRYEYNKSFNQACKTARGLRSCIQLFVCEHRGDFEAGWECMRKLVTDLNLFHFSHIEKNEWINTLFYLVAPLGEKYIWYDRESHSPREIEVDRKLHEAMRQEVKILLQNCSPSGSNQINARRMIEQIRELDKLGRIDQIIKDL